MKIVAVLLCCLAVLSCKEATKESISSDEIQEETISQEVSKYPEAFTKILTAHGGHIPWKKKRNLTFEIPKPDAKEVHTTDLHSRKDKIEMQNFSMGFDGQEVWLLDEKQVYKGDPVFYHNLMFYFYAMPFVLADSGIQYGKTENLEFDGISYPGIRISYNSDIGTSPKDEYYIHYNPKTFQMEWLGYTVTYRSGEKSDNVKWIRYHDWMNVDGLMLPKSLTWYEYEGRTIKEARDPLNFENVKLSEIVKPAGFFTRPKGAKIVNGKTE